MRSHSILLSNKKKRLLCLDVLLRTSSSLSLSLSLSLSPQQQNKQQTILFLFLKLSKTLIFFFCWLSRFYRSSLQPKKKIKKIERKKKEKYQQKEDNKTFNWMINSTMF